MNDMDIPAKILREKLLELLGIRCVFPCGLSTAGNVARCMLEIDGSKVTPFEDATEDVVVKLFENKISKEVTIHFIVENLAFDLSLFHSGC